MSKQDFKGQLARQLGFIRRSCKAFDAGNRDEAIRIAVATRVLVHDTGNSTSLLTHLGAKGISLRSTVPVVQEPPRITIMDGLVMNIDGRFVPKLDGKHSGCTFAKFVAREPPANLDLANLRVEDLSPPDIEKPEMPVDEWWNQLVIVNKDARFRRRDLILDAANKDGGAHVDEEVPDRYYNVQFDFWINWDSFGRAAPVTETHLLSMRQIGYELLNSPELLALAA